MKSIRPTDPVGLNVEHFEVLGDALKHTLRSDFVSHLLIFYGIYVPAKT